MVSEGRRRHARLLAGSGKPLFDVLRDARTIALRAIEPFDALHRRVTGRGNLPPLWLRRHVGPIASFEHAPGEMSATIALLGLLHSHSSVLDVGCGCGAMAFEFQRMLGSSGRYIGFDVHAPSINWSRRHFRKDSRFRFELAEIGTAYSREFETATTEYRFPVEDNTVDLVLAKSLFTHLLEDEASHYFREIRRSLSTNGRALVSVFLLDEDGKPRTGEFAPHHDFRFGANGMRWLAEGRPTAGVAYIRSHLDAMLATSGLSVDSMHLGYWAGYSIAPNAQDLLVLSVKP